jgi:hypothetical protein
MFLLKDKTRAIKPYKKRKEFELKGSLTDFKEAAVVNQSQRESLQPNQMDESESLS